MQNPAKKVAAATAIAFTLLVPASPAAAGAPRHASRSDRALAAAVDRYARGLNLRRDALPAVQRAHLPARVADALTAELTQLRHCDVITRTNIDTLTSLFPGGTGLPLGQPAVNPYPVQQQGSTVLGFPVPPAPNPPVYQQYPFQPQVERCGAATVTKLDAVRTAIQRSHLRASQSIDVWPVLAFSPGSGHHVYENDYVLLVDTGSHNTFDNNAGGNAIDIWRGPAGQRAPIIGPARGCIDAFDIIRQRTCTIASAALLDLGGDNTFGRKTAPDPATDGVCTASPLEPRVFVQGTGILGVGVLIDEGSHNTFTGKVLTTGTGHVGGYGYLRDDGSYNTYSVIRDGLGDAVVGGTGTLIANGAHNTYGTYMPAAINPFAAAGTYGSGGVVDDLNNCDAGTGLTLGAGEVAGVGHFEATGGQNSYSAPIDSLGYGGVAGKGTFSDTGSGGTDTYSGPGAAGRGAGVTVSPTSDDNGSFTDS
jgi:hypothetical protein